jgi:flagellar biosynthesis protein FliR
VTGWHLGRPIPEEPSIWRRPIQVALLVGLAYAALAIPMLPPGLAGGDVLWILAGQLVHGAIVGFLLAVFLLTYIRVSELARR